MTGAEFCQLLLQLVICFIQHPVVLCFLLLIQGEGIIQLHIHTHTHTHTHTELKIFLPLPELHMKTIC